VIGPPSLKRQVDRVADPDAERVVASAPVRGEFDVAVIPTVTSRSPAATCAYDHATGTCSPSTAIRSPNRPSSIVPEMFVTALPNPSTTSTSPVAPSVSTAGSGNRTFSYSSTDTNSSHSPR
jgi:hypothetical protein